MADSTLRLTFQQLQIRVADFLGIANRSGSSLAVPSDAKNLELVKRLVNDGYRRMLTDYEKWNVLNVPLTINFVAQLEGTITAVVTGATPSITVGSFAGTYANDYFNGFELTVDEDTVNEVTLTVLDYVGATGQFTFAAQAIAAGTTIASGDTLKIAGLRNPRGIAWRYYLPDDFYGLWKVPLTYSPNGPRVRITEVTEGEIREMRAGARTAGDPLFVAFRPINTVATTDGKRWEALFWPEPNTLYPVQGIYKRFPAALSADGDTSVFGFHHDGTVLAASLAAAELFRHDKMGIHETTYQTKLATAIKLDARSSPRNNRPFGDHSDEAVGMRTSDHFAPATYNGVDV